MKIKSWYLQTDFQKKEIKGTLFYRYIVDMCDAKCMQCIMNEIKKKGLMHV
jgi:hypothetical protein